ncbi:DUF5990 family protein [Streptomyces sp. NBC_00190]|uniref:DUF5990 family protein n=1 Tax=unclassified Streptomyces TaxID=2593676 RepID=UPI002E2C154A|nr:DUF5990 family protein [Streptomyces sp. NBC_00190]WSZ44262.1 DUF5990 family protein [Streptomyces sp. NBC_00868]
MQIRIEAFDLPGRTCAAGPGFPGYADVHVAVQLRSPRGELLGPQPGDASAVSWTLECDVATTPTGFDFRGPHLDPATVRSAVLSGLLLAPLGLTDAKGQLLCAAVRPPRVAWSAGPEPDAPVS